MDAHTAVHGAKTHLLPAASLGIRPFIHHLLVARTFLARRVARHTLLNPVRQPRIRPTTQRGRLFFRIRKVVVVRIRIERPSAARLRSIHVLIHRFVVSRSVLGPFVPSKIGLGRASVLLRLRMGCGVRCHVISSNP